MTMIKPIAFISETTGHFYMITEKNNSWERCWQSTAFTFFYENGQQQVSVSDLSPVITFQLILGDIILQLYI